MIGDIVSVFGRDGLWTVLEANDGPHLRVRQDVPQFAPTDLTVRAHAVELLLRPVIKEGMALRYGEQSVTVIRAGATRINISMEGAGTASVPKGAIVSDNVNLLLQTQGADNDPRPAAA